MMKTPLQQHQQEEDDFKDTSTPEPEPPLNNSSSDGGYYHSYDHASAFFSDPSISPEESEEIGSSIDDAQKKWLYRQQLRNAAAAAAATGANNTNGRQQQQQQQQQQHRISGGGGGGGDDDTSLSSSNLSPMPQRVVQLTSSNSDILFTERRNQIRAAARSPLIRLQSETSNSDGVSGMTDSMNRTNSEATMLEAAALLPPSLPFTKTTNNENETNDDHPATGRRWKNSNTDTSSSNEAATATTDEEANNNGQHHHVTFFPTMPKLDSTDSLRGMDITSSGGESSTDNKNKNNNMTSSPPLIRGTTVEIRVGGENHNKKKSSPRKHKRQRSGDLVAATIMNPNGKDWIGMNRDNLPLPETPNPNNDDDSLLLSLPQQQDQHHESSSRIVDGRDTRVSSPPLYPYHTSNANGGESSGIFSPGSSDRIFSPDSSERYHFSDSSGGGGGGVSNNTAAYLHHQHFLHQQQTGYIVNPRHHHNQHHQQQYHAVPMYDTYGYNPNNMQWYQPNYHIPEVYRRHRNDSDEDDSEEEGSSYSGSGEGGGGTTSSSYVTEDDEEDASKSTRSSSSSPPRSSSRDGNDVEIPPPHPFSISGHNKPPSFETESPPEILIDRSTDSKFDQIMKKVTSVLDKPLYRPKGQLEIPDDKNYPTFFCPNCKTRQRAFLSVATASEQTSSPLGYLALYFALYMVSSLFIFGLEEGWQPLDCVYFSVITLTTAGLGDLVPTTDGAKIVCACFIYVGVATIGLLLGSLLAGSLDDATKKDAYNAQVKDCPNCQRLERLKSSSRPMSSSGTSPMAFPPYYDNNANSNNDGYEEVGEAAEQSSATSGSDASFPDVGLDLANNNDTTTQRRAAPPRNGHTRHMSLLVSNSPKSRQKKSNVLPLESALKGKKSHTRHMSLANSLSSPPKPTSLPDGLDKIDESTPLMDLKRSEYSTNDKTTRSAEVKFCEESSYSTSSTDTSNLHPSKPLTRLKAAKYIFLTLNQALANSVFIIAAGSIGFYYIEKMSVVDSFYFTTVLLTSVGYGDIVPVTAAGKMFTTVFIIVAGTILLHNMTLISMIPLELRKRRIEHAVLGQFGDRLTDDELRELSTGTLVNRLKLATNRPDGLDECTREMFSLAMLVRLGRVTEEDVKATFAAFRRLDVGNYGRLNSRTIIEGELMRRRALSSKNLVAMSNESDWEGGPSPSNYSRGSVPMYAPPHYAPGMYGGATPRSQYSSPDSPRTQYSETPNFNFDEYEQWASNWGHYDTFHH